MSEILVRRALEKHLLGMASGLADTIFENDQREPPADASTPYQKVFFLPAKPENQVQGGGVCRLNGTFQVSLLYPLGAGPGDAGAQAELLRTRFKRGTTIAESGLNVNITDTPHVAKGYEDGPRWHVPVSITWHAWAQIA